MTRVKYDVRKGTVDRSAKPNQTANHTPEKIKITHSQVSDIKKAFTPIKLNKPSITKNVHMKNHYRNSMKSPLSGFTGPQQAYGLSDK